MIAIPRLVLRQFRLALKRSFPPRCRPEQQLWVVIETSKEGMTLCAQHVDAAIRFQLSGHHAPAVMGLPARALDEAQGRDGMVTVERNGETVVASWEDNGIPRRWSIPPPTWTRSLRSRRHRLPSLRSRPLYSKLLMMPCIAPRWTAFATPSARCSCGVRERSSRRTASSS